MFRNPPICLETGAFFSPDERRRLAHLAAEYSLRELLDNPRTLGRPCHRIRIPDEQT